MAAQYITCERRGKAGARIRRVNVEVCRARSAGEKSKVPEFNGRDKDGKLFFEECIGCVSWIEKLEKLEEKES